MSLVSELRKPPSPPTRDNSGKPPSEGGGDENKNTSRISKQSQKYQRQHELTAKQKNILDKIQKFLVTPINYFTGVMGLLSTVLPNFFNSENDLVDKIANYASKAGIYATSLFSALNRAWSKDMIGTLAFTTDFITATLANDDDLYQWKGFGSGLDHGPLILGEVATNPEIVEEYELTQEDAESKKAKFQDYKSFWDSTKKIGSGIRVIVKDTFNEFKNNNPVQAFKNCFLTGKRNAEKNLLVSGVGIIAGAFLSTILGLKKLGSTIRDSFGLYADLAYIAKGLSTASNENTLKTDSQKKYFESGIEYTIGSVLDLIYRWTEIRGLNYLALGVDRIGARNAVLGIVKESEGN